ncbi:MAG: thioether cross-link-forming SCIFF peptide maturase [Clostridium sp.]
MMKIHKFEQCGLKILIDVNSGAIHIVDDVVYDILDHYEDGRVTEEVKKLEDKYSKNQLEESIKEVNELISGGMLFTDDPYKEMILNDDGPSYVKAMCLNIAHDCNLKCKYCFADEGEYHGKRSMMSPEIGKKAIDFVIKTSGPRKNIEVDLFGGEPLMNFKAVKEIVEYGKVEGNKNNKNIRFTMTTNATLLNDEIMDYIDKNMGNVVLSIDGRREVNDKIRTRCDGSGTYDAIMPKIKKMVEMRDKSKQYYVRGTFTRENLDFYEDVILMADEGFKEVSNEPVVLEDGHPLAIRQEDLPIIFEQYDKLTNEIIKREKDGRGFKFYHFAMDINGGPCVYKRISGCGAGYEYVAVTPEGDIYPCHQFVGNEEFKLGNVESLELDSDIENLFKNGNIYNKPKCEGCWAKFYCSGGCQANNYSFNKDIHIPYEIGCEMIKKRIECAITIKAKLL